MRRIVMIAALGLGVIPPAARAGEGYDVELTTNQQSAVAGTTNLKAIRVQSDLGEIKIPIERLISLSQVGYKEIKSADGTPGSVPIHEIITAAGSRIRGAIVDRTFTLTCEFGDLEVSWDRVATLNRPSQFPVAGRAQVPSETTTEEVPEPATTPRR